MLLLLVQEDDEPQTWPPDYAVDGTWDQDDPLLLVPEPFLRRRNP